jgi:hypothetical protein
MTKPGATIELRAGKGYKFLPIVVILLAEASELGALLFHAIAAIIGPRNSS